MASLSIGKAWSEATAFFGHHGQPVFLIAMLAFALPNLLLQMVTGQMGANPFAQGAAEPEPGWWMLLIPVVSVVGLIGGLAITWLAVRASTTVGEGLAVALRRILPLFGAILLLSLVGIALLLPFILLLVLTDPAAGTQELSGLAVVLIFLFVIVVCFFSVRLSLITAVAAAEQAGPVGIIKRGWALTAGHFWRLLGFYILFGILAGVAMLAIGLVLGVVVLAVSGGASEPSSLAALFIALVGSVLQAAVTALFTVAVARIYAQLAGPDAGEIFG